MNRAKFYIQIPIIILFLFSVKTLVLAEKSNVSPFIQLKQEYSDNILFSENNEESDFITTISGGLELTRESATTQLKLLGQLDQLIYLDNDDLDDLEYNTEGTISHDLTERLSANAAAGYERVARRDRDTDPTGLVVSGARDTFTASAGSNYKLSEISNIDLTLNFRNRQIDETLEEEENDTYSVNLAYNRNLSEHFKNTIGSIYLNYTRYTAESEDTVQNGALDVITDQEYTSDIFRLSAGVSKDISELYNIFFQAGTTYSKTDEESITRTVNRSTRVLVGTTPLTTADDDTFGGLLATGLRYKDIFYDIGLTLSHDVRGATGTNGVVQRTALSGRLARKVSDEFFLTFNASVYKNENDRDIATDTDELTFNIQPGFRYLFTRDLIFSCVYRFTSVEDKEADTTRERNLVFISLKKKFDLN